MGGILLSAFVMLAGLSGGADGDALWKTLLEAPPSAGAAPARQAAVEALDYWIAQPDSERSPEHVAYYRRAVDRVIQTMQAGRPGTGIRCFQLYSSSVIVQSPTCAFAIDLDQGPNENLHQTPEEEGVLFCMTDGQVAALANLIDCSFHTHEHADHIDFELTKALLERDKTVVATDGTKKVWAGEAWADKIVTPKQTLGQGVRVGGLEVNVLWDHQWNNSEHSSGTPCNAYVITTPEGITVATKGDINCALQWYGWLNVLVERGRSIDVMVGSPIYWKGVTLTREIDALLSPLWLPGHNWEFVHRKSGERRGNASAFWQSDALLQMAAPHAEVTVLTWGEYIDLQHPRPHDKDEMKKRRGL